MPPIQHLIKKSAPHTIIPILQIAKAKYKILGLCCQSDPIYKRLLPMLQGIQHKLADTTLFPHSPRKSNIIALQWAGLVLDERGDFWENVIKALKRQGKLPDTFSLWVYTYQTFPFNTDDFPYTDQEFGEYLVTESHDSFILTEKSK